MQRRRLESAKPRMARCALVPERQGREGRGRGGRHTSISGVLAGYQMLPLEKAEL